MLQIPSKLSAVIGLFGLALATSSATAGALSVAYVSSTVVCDYPTIQAAILDLAAGAEIRLVGDEFLLGGSLTAFNRDLRIVGGYPACGAPASTSTTTLRANFSGGPVISASGNVPGALLLELVNLSIVDADNPSGNGGGMLISGEGQVSLFNVDVLNNIAEDGAGIYTASPTPGALSVNLVNGTRVGTGGAGNVALSVGGGLYCIGARIRLGAVEINGNTGGSEGGGVRAFNGCQLLSTADVGDTRIDGNTANVGGGIYASGGASINLQARPGQRLSISGNSAQGDASPRGGGVHLTDAGTQLTAFGAWIENNQARLAGAGLFVNNGSSATLGRGTDACAIGDDQCSRISGNQLRNADGSLSGNGAGAFVSGATLTISHTRFEANAANNGAVLRANGTGHVSLDNVLIRNNISPARLLNIDTETTATLDFVTVVDNDFTLAAINVSSTAPLALAMTRSIFLVEPGQTHIQGSGTTMFACLNTGDGGALGGDAHAPAFFDAEAGIYRLRSDSQNLDRCAADGNESAFDLSGLPRNVDRPGVPNNTGPLDRGAYEDVEGLFAGGFED